MLNFFKNHTQDNYLSYIESHRPNAVAYMNGLSDYPNIYGKVKFYQTSDGVLVLTELTGLPNITSDHDFFAMHIHDSKTCNPSDLDQSVHFNPTNVAHPHHAGDLPVILSNNGNAYQLTLTNLLTVSQIIDNTVIIHKYPDDFRTDPSGNSGEKIACGKIISTK